MDGQPRGVAPWLGVAGLAPDTGPALDAIFGERRRVNRGLLDVPAAKHRLAPGPASDVGTTFGEYGETAAGLAAACGIGPAIRS
ncbi:hypothetical protein [Actinoplanes xinjiangensis]|uniref:hypothetical protein n=1 Tax=Actinoplanes xinjiangensis TaxID=512350 RepID=UPI0034439E75